MEKGDVVYHVLDNRKILLLFKTTSIYGDVWEGVYVSNDRYINEKFYFFELKLTNKESKVSFK